MAADVTRVIGIDFGTSTSVVCVKRYQNGEALGGAFLSSSVTFGNGQGDTRAFTIVRRNSDGTYTCGREAEEQDPGTEVFREFKMELENPDETKSAQAKDLTEEFFKYLYRWYDHQRSNLGEAGDREKTLVSFPAKWSEDTRKFMAEAAKKAGFPDVSVMDEPSAALYATLTQNMNDVSAKGLLRAGKPGYMLLIDMGAGTTDLAVCRYSVEAGADDVIRAEQIKNEIVSTWPESAGAPTFGGREVDRILEGYLTDYMISCGLPENKVRQLVCGASPVKSWKENTVSARLNEGAPVDSCGFVAGYMMMLDVVPPFPAIDRGKFEELLAEKLGGFKSLVTGCLDKACALEPDIAQNGVDLVVLTGGHSVWYFTEELLNGTMSGISHPALKRVQAEKSRVMRLSNPQETVALGLVYSLLPMKVEKGGGRPSGLQWPFVDDEAFEALAREYLAEDPGPTLPYEQAKELADRLRGDWEPENILAVWTDPETPGIVTPLGFQFEDSTTLLWMKLVETDWRPGSWIGALSMRLRRRINFLWRYDLDKRPAWPGTPDETLRWIAGYFITNHGLDGVVDIVRSGVKPIGVRVNNKAYTWRDLMEKNLGAAPREVLDLQSYLRFLLRLDDEPTWLHWPEVSAEDYADLAQYITDLFGWNDGDHPVIVGRSQAEPLVRRIMEKWRMCPDQPVFGVAPEIGDGCIICRDGFCGLDAEPMSWEAFLELDVSGSVDLAPLQSYLRRSVHYRWEGAKAPVWPNVTDGVIGALMRIYAFGHMKNAYVPTARELPYYEETVKSLRSRYKIPPNENIIAVRPDKEKGMIFTEKGVYAPTTHFTWRGVVGDDKVPEKGLVHDVQEYLRERLQYKRPAQSPHTPQPSQPSRPAQPETPVSACTVTVTRKKQFTGAVMTMCLQVDERSTYDIGFGKTISVPLAPGKHSFTFWLNGTPGRKFPIKFDVERDMDLIAEVGGMPDFVITLKENVGNK